MTQADPRQFPAAADAPPEFANLYAAVVASLGASTAQASATHDQRIRTAITAWLAQGQGPTLARLFELAPSVATHRHLRRLLAECERAPRGDEALAVHLFAIAIVIVAASEVAADARIVVPAVLPDVAQIGAILREHNALAGNRNFALANALVAADALDVARLPELLAWRALPTPTLPPRELAPAPIEIAGRHEGAHLRFLVGSALAAPGSDPLRDATVGGWGMPLALALAGQLQVPGVSLLALPRAPQSPTLALATGRVAQREVAAQLFVSNAIRRLRAAVGEPTAVISVHRMTQPAGAGEVRLSLSSPFDPREAEGFRYRLAPSDRVDDIVKLFTDLMRDCRVNDVQFEPGVHADRDPLTGHPLLFKSGLPRPPALH